MYYFASDLHLGLTGRMSPTDREQLFIKWLDEISPTAKGIFLVGDIFDFWFEYRHAVPRGHTRLLGKLSELTDQGISIHFFVGNHDIWTFDYLHNECGLIVHHEPYCIMELLGKQFLIGHGDMMGKRTFKQRLYNSMFRSRLLQWLFSWVHPDVGIRLGKWWSRSSRRSKPLQHTFRGEEEPTVGFARNILQRKPIDWFIFGHVHIAKVYPLDPHESHIAFLGEWISSPTYGILTEEGFELRSYPDSKPIEP